MPTFADEVIESYGVVLRPLTGADVPAIAVACSDPLTQQRLPLPRLYTEDIARCHAVEMAPAALASGRGLERLRRAGYVHNGKVDLAMLSRLVDDPRPNF